MNKIEWIDVIRSSYPEFDIYTKGTVAKLEADRDEYRNLYHMGEAKVRSREAIIEQLYETELAKDVTRLEAELEKATERMYWALQKEYKQLEAEIALKADYIKRLEAGQGFHPSCLAVDENVERLEAENEALRGKVLDMCKDLLDTDEEAQAVIDALLTGDKDA